ncbi:MAG: hypothetical protein AAGM38_09195 [Pseudomonadota bacterium]
MSAATALFAIEDAFIKTKAQSYPVGQALLGSGLGGMIAPPGVLALSGPRNTPR